MNRLAEPKQSEIISLKPDKKEKKPQNIIAINFLSQSTNAPGFAQDFQLSWDGNAVRNILGNPIKAYLVLASCNVTFTDNGNVRYNSEAICRLGIAGGGKIPQNTQQSITSNLNLASSSILGEEVCFSTVAPYSDQNGSDLDFTQAMNQVGGLNLLIRPTVNVGFVPPAAYFYTFQGCIKFKVTNF